MNEIDYIKLSGKAKKYSVTLSEYIRQTIFGKQDTLPKYRYEGTVKEIISELNLSCRRLNRMDVRDKEIYYNRIHEMVSQVIMFFEEN